MSSSFVVACGKHQKAKSEMYTSSKATLPAPSSLDMYPLLSFYSKVRSEAGLHAILYLHLIILQQN